MPTRNNEVLHVIMANGPRLLREMLGKVLNRHEQLNVIGGEMKMQRLALLIELFQPDWIVLTLCQDGSFPRIADSLIARNPEVGILAIDEIGARARARCGDLIIDSLALDELVSLLSTRSRLSNKVLSQLSNH